MAAKNLITSAALLFLSFVSLSAQSVTLPFTIDDRNLLTVTASINGEEKHLLIDTAAERSLIIEKGTPAGQRKTIISFARTCRLVMPIVFVDLSAKDNVVLKGKEGVTITTAFQKRDGVLGQDVLSQFNRVIFDYKKHTITFE